MKYNINELTLEEKIGQMLMVGFEGNKITQRNIDQIQKYKVGGIILYKKNFNSYDEMINIITQLKQLNKENKIPLFIAVDQEGGRVNRIPKEILNLPAPYNIVKKLGQEGIEKAALIIAEILRKSGYNVNFAPNLDVNRYENNRNVVGDRSFSEEIDVITKMALIQKKIYEENGIIPVAKHFPGHGATQKDSHYFSPKISLNYEELLNKDLKPYEEIIKSEIDCILVGHLKIKSIDKYNPCSLSKTFLSQELRGRFNYNGLIISDDLKMRAIQNFYGYENAAIKAVQAGNDIIMFRYNVEKEKSTINRLITYTKKNKINIENINSSVERILNLKEKYDITDSMPTDRINIDEINKKIQEIRNQVL